MRRYVDNIFSTAHKPTVGVDFHLKQLTVGTTAVKLQLWDIAGQDRFGKISRVYYKEAVGALIVYDVNRPKTFESVTKVLSAGCGLVFVANIFDFWFTADQWKAEIDSKIFLPSGKPIPVVLLGNKCDLETAETDQYQLEKFVKDNKFVGTFDTSAKLNINIDKAARLLVEKILEHGNVLAEKQAAQVW